MPVKISVFGLGYVGSVSAACLARDGAAVVGVDPQQAKVDLINAGRSPIIEPGLAELVARATREGRLRATVSAAEAVRETDLSMICVGTPSLPNGNLDLRSLLNACREIGAALRDKAAYHVVVVRSTMLPGTMREAVLPTLETASGKRAGADFGLANNPEFLREGSAIADFDHPAKTVIGALDERAAAIVAEIYHGLEAPLFPTSIEVAEMVKYVDNSFHALKVAFSNEIGNVCKALAIDSHAVMDIFCQDRKLNLSPAYLRPGFAFGGSCLPKDLRALSYKAKSLDLSLPVLDSVLASNRLQVERAVQMILARERRKVGVLGFSFKAGTDDLRESPVVELVERLIGKGLDLRLYDRNVSLAKLVGANRDYILRVIPHISRLMVDDPGEVIDHGEIIVIGNGDPEFADALGSLRDDQFVLDMVRVSNRGQLNGHYDGINW
jgi:GDP-mannose 6-dehydrogenase